MIAAFLLDAKGGARELTWDEVLAWNPDQGVLWIHLDRAEENTHEWLRTLADLPELAIEALLQEETRPRAAHFGENLLIILRAVNLNPGAEPEDMISVRCWFEPYRVITLRQRKVAAINDMRERLTGGRGPRTSGDLLAQLIDDVVHHIVPVVEEIEDNLANLEEEILEGSPVALRKRLGDLRREAIQLRRFTSPERDLLNRLSVEPAPWMTDLDRAHIREAADRLTRLIEDLDTVRERASVTHEELTTRLSETLNTRLYALSLVSTTFMPLTFITGLLGMNVAGIPFAESPWAFAAVIAFTLLLATVQYCVFRRKGWL